jgi:hypothetical protein
VSVKDLDGLLHYGFGGPIVRAEVKTADCGCKFVGNAGLRDVHVVERCDRHERKAKR